MILQALCAYAEREHLVEDPVLEMRKVDYILTVRNDGLVVGATPTAGDDGRAKMMAGPRAPKRAVNIVAGLLFDNSTYVLEVAKVAEDDSEPSDAEREKARVRAHAFEVAAEGLARGSTDAGVQAVFLFSKRRDENRKRVFNLLPAVEWTGSEWLAFSLADAEGELIYQRPGVKDALRSVSSVASSEASVGQCLVTGQIGPLARLHPSIKHVPKGQSSGASLVSFNADAFTSHGLSQGDNAPISERSAMLYGAALNHMLERTPARYYRSGVGVGDDAVIVFWTRHRDDTADFLASLFQPSTTDVTNVMESPWKGLEPGEFDAEPFYAMTLGGNASRVVVRDWLEVTTGAVKASVRLYFQDLQISEKAAKPLPLWMLLKAVESPGGQGLSPQLGARLFRSALSGAPFPRELLGLALRRLRLPPKDDEASITRHRCALIKAVLCRQFRNAGRKELTVSLDESNHEVPYLLGRLFAVLERLQRVAQGDVNVSIRDRFFGSASATPSLVFPRLLKLSIHHAAKAESSGWLEKIKGQVIDALPPARFPGTLSLDDQGLFAVGYYHQREWFFVSHAS